MNILLLAYFVKFKTEIKEIIIIKDIRNLKHNILKILDKKEF